MCENIHKIFEVTGMDKLYRYNIQNDDVGFIQLPAVYVAKLGRFLERPQGGETEIVLWNKPVYSDESGCYIISTRDEIRLTDDMFEKALACGIVKPVSEEEADLLIFVDG